MSDTNIDSLRPPAFLRVQPDGIVVSIKLQPRASSNEIGEALGEELRIKVSAPPVDSAANEALLRLLARELDYPRNRIELIRGHSSRHKMVKVHGISLEQVMRKLSLPQGDSR
jgi:uncharacterized protein (TIGR00251 family)